MCFRNILFSALIVLMATMCSACGASGSTSADHSSQKSYSIESADTTAGKLAALSSSDNTASSSETISDIEAEAKKLHTTPGRVALAIIINKLDNATVIDDMSKKSAQELFELLRQTATQKSQTLEGLDKQYFLSDILASDGIYVDFKANNVVSSGSGSQSSKWIKKFEQAIKK